MSGPVSLTCGRYEGGAFWDGTFEPGLSPEPPECGHVFVYDPGADEPSSWVLCPKCSGEVCVDG